MGLVPAVRGGNPIGALTSLEYDAVARCAFLLAVNRVHSQGSGGLHNLNKCVRKVWMIRGYK